MSLVTKMCGIAGIISLNGKPVPIPVLQKMADLLAHRGPDGSGFLLGWGNSGGFKHNFIKHTDQWRGAGTVRLGFGHRRLAILDLSEHGLQPMHSRDGQTWIVFNGEIYNYLELRQHFQARGTVFQTHTDTEVLLQAYQHWGEACVDHIEGMYAFAIWDAVHGRLFCARDRLGIKPFYYATPPGYFIFASEIKSLLSFPCVEAIADDASVMEFLVHGNCDYGERTVLQNIKALPAAHTLVLDICAQQPAVRRYWQLEPQSQIQIQNGAGDREQIAQLKELLTETVRKHLNSDVRVGSCLSGGLDSSAVVGLIGKISREEPHAAAAIDGRLRTFTSCYANPEFDERDYALAVARSAEANPHLVFPSPRDFWANFERMAWHQDMPFGSLSYYAQWRVMQAAKESGVKVLIDGQGGDEVFGGYAKFRYAYLLSLLLSGRFPKMVAELWHTVRQGDRYVLDVRNGYRYLPASLRSLFDLDSLLDGVVKADWGGLISAETNPGTFWWRNALSRSQSPKTLLQRIQLRDIFFDTLPQLLRFEDRSSMAFSLEARVPLLDHKLVTYGVCLPDHLKLRKGWSKFAVRRAMEGIVPDLVRWRKTKLGFAAPDRHWLSDSLRTEISDFLSGRLFCEKYIDPGKLRDWYHSRHARTPNTESYLGLFRILSLEMWMRVFNVRAS